MTICDIINKIFISEDMKKYLCKKADKLNKFQIQNMITSAPTISLQKKLEFIVFMAQDENLQQELAGNPNECEFIIENSFSACADNIRRALEALNVSDSSIFLIKINEWINNEFITSEAIPFSCYEKATDFIKNEYQKSVCSEERIWFIIEKWETDSIGNMKETYSYVIVNNEIIYYRHKDIKMGEAWPDRNLNLPVPFKAGDIIEVHDMPFVDSRIALITDIGDNTDCCSVWEVHIDEDGVIVESALKHGDVFGLNPSMATSPLYSAVKVNGLHSKGPSFTLRGKQRKVKY